MRHSLTREFGRQGHQGLCTDVWVAAGQQVSANTEGSEGRLGHKAAEVHRPGGAGVSCTRQGHRRRQADTGRQPGTLPFWVSVESKVEDAGQWLKSTETSGLSL